MPMKNKDEVLSPCPITETFGRTITQLSAFRLNTSRPAIDANVEKTIKESTLHPRLYTFKCCLTVWHGGRFIVDYLTCPQLSRYCSFPHVGTKRPSFDPFTLEGLYDMKKMLKEEHQAMLRRFTVERFKGTAPAVFTTKEYMNCAKEAIDLLEQLRFLAAQGLFSKKEYTPTKGELSLPGDLLAQITAKTNSSKSSREKALDSLSSVRFEDGTSSISFTFGNSNSRARVKNRADGYLP